ncbi:MAG: DUF4304 domain-containing protein [Planctomycetota bacterium]
MKSDPQDAFKELTRRSGLVLREHGFKGSGQNFYRDKGETWQALNFQRTQWRLSPDDPVNFTMNMGIYIPSLDRTNLPMPMFEKISDVRRFRATNGDEYWRVGQFLADGRDQWWDVCDDLLETMWKDFDGLLRDTVIPAFDVLSTRAGASRVAHWCPYLVGLSFRKWLAELAPPEWNVQAARQRSAEQKDALRRQRPSWR